jgi:hypothetical protein
LNLKQGLLLESKLVFLHLAFDAGGIIMVA